VAPGEYTARFSRPGFVKQDVAVKVAPGKSVTVRPDAEAWQHETGDLELSAGSAADVRFTLAAKKGDGTPRALAPGTHKLDTGSYALTLTRAHAAQQVKDVEIGVNQRTKVAAPEVWEPLPECVAALKAWAFDKKRADIQRKDSPRLPDLPEWVCAPRTNALLREAEGSAKLKALKEIYDYWHGLRETLMEQDKVNKLAALFAEGSGYSPNAADAEMVGELLSMYEEKNRSLQSRAKISAEEKDVFQKRLAQVQALSKRISGNQQVLVN